jgi:protein phosphatase
MGTTLVGALVMGEYASIINVGDSRAYHITAEGIWRITKDHSLVQDMIDRGEIKREEAVTHPDRNLITRALGVEPGVLCDLFEIRIKKGESLLLCTDGLTNCLDEKLIWETVALSNEGVEATCQKLIELAIEAGATDNVTAVLLQK